MAELLLRDALSKLIRLEDAIQNVLETEGAEAAKKAMSSRVHLNVYKAYPIHNFPRRMDDGGLSDTENYLSRVYKSGEVFVLTVENNTPFQNKNIIHTNLTHVVQEGDPNFAMPFPRPFIEDAQNDLVNGELLAAITEGLGRRGL